MQNRILLLLSGVLSLIYFIIPSSSNTTIFYTEKKKEINVKNTKTNELKKLDLEDYIISVVSAEMPASFDEEALKAQAIASRTYAAYKMSTAKGEYDVVTDVSNQSYITIDEMKNKWGNDFDKYYNRIKKAVNDTSNMVMYYNDEIVHAYYFAMSNGYTENVSLVFGEEKDYLKPVQVPGDKNVNNFEVEKTINKNEICSKLNISCDNFNITNIKRSETGRVNSLDINGNNYKGTNIRHTLGLRSTDFEISIDGDNVIFKTKGYGHGVGMSQYGANGLAKEGYKYDEILKYFYKNVEIKSI